MISNHDDVAKHLDTIARSFTDALNNRQLTMDNPLFQNHIDPNFRAIPGHPAPQTPLQIAEYIAWSQKVITEQPLFQQEFIDTNVHIEEKTQQAEVLVNYRVHGAPPGIVHSAIAIFKFRLRSDPQDAGVKRWKCYNLDVMDGMGGR